MLPFVGMPYGLKRAACSPKISNRVKKCYKVCRTDVKGRCFSKGGIPLARARRQKGHIESSLRLPN